MEKKDLITKIIDFVSPFFWIGIIYLIFFYYKFLIPLLNQKWIWFYNITFAMGLLGLISFFVKIELKEVKKEEKE